MSQSKAPQGRHLKAGLLASSRLGHRPAGAHLGDASRACQRIVSQSASRGRISSTPLVVGRPGICCWLEAAHARTWQLVGSQATWAQTSLHSGLSTLPQRFRASQTCLVPGVVPVGRVYDMLCEMRRQPAAQRCQRWHAQPALQIWSAGWDTNSDMTSAVLWPPTQHFGQQDPSSAWH